MASSTTQIIKSIAGLSMSAQILSEDDGSVGLGPSTINAGKSVTDWVKTDSDTAACNLPDGHGYSSGKMDVYWTGGVRYNVDGTVTGDALTLDGGAGDDFPASASTDVVVCTVQTFDFDFDGDNLVDLGINSDRRAHVAFLDSGDAVLAAFEIIAGSIVQWIANQGTTTPITGNPVDYVQVSCGDSDYDATIKIGVLHASES